MLFRSALSNDSEPRDRSRPRAFEVSTSGQAQANSITLYKPCTERSESPAIRGRENARYAPSILHKRTNQFSDKSLCFTGFGKSLCGLSRSGSSPLSIHRWQLFFFEFVSPLTKFFNDFVSLLSAYPHKCLPNIGEKHLRSKFSFDVTLEMVHHFHRLIV